MIKNYNRTCKYCEKVFETAKKYSQVCPVCFAKNHHKKVVRNLFNHKS